VAGRARRQPCILGSKGLGFFRRQLPILGRMTGWAPSTRQDLIGGQGVLDAYAGQDRPAVLVNAFVIA
jgi:hypothetical protein